MVVAGGCADRCKCRVLCSGQLGHQRHHPLQPLPGYEPQRGAGRTALDCGSPIDQCPALSTGEPPWTGGGRVCPRAAAACTGVATPPMERNLGPVGALVTAAAQLSAERGHPPGPGHGADHPAADARRGLVAHQLGLGCCRHRRLSPVPQQLAHHHNPGPGSSADAPWTAAEHRPTNHRSGQLSGAVERGHRPESAGRAREAQQLRL